MSIIDFVYLYLKTSIGNCSIAGLGSILRWYQSNTAFGGSAHVTLIKLVPNSGMFSNIPSGADQLYTNKYI